MFSPEQPAVDTRRAYETPELTVLAVQATQSAIGVAATETMMVGAQRLTIPTS